MAKDMNLTAQEIYEKEFHVDLKGYAPAEVDEFLDMVIEDYQKYDEKVEELGAAVTRYEEKIKELQQQLFALQSENENLNEKVNSDFVNGSSNTVDILKRIARLEKAVFNQSEEQVLNRQSLATQIVRGKSMLAQSVMIVVFVLDE